MIVEVTKTLRFISIDDWDESESQIENVCFFLWVVEGTVEKICNESHFLTNLKRFCYCCYFLCLWRWHDFSHLTANVLEINFLSLYPLLTPTSTNWFQLLNMFFWFDLLWVTMSDCISWYMMTFSDLSLIIRRIYYAYTSTIIYTLRDFADN